MQATTRVAAVDGLGLTSHCLAAANLSHYFSLDIVILIVEFELFNDTVCTRDIQQEG